MAIIQPEKQRQFATDAVRRLRAAGFAAYWAGGCVRDQLLGRAPKDYDVATDATPEQIRQVFADRRTLNLGEAFGVVAVLGPRGAGQLEVTTFRRDATYSDGRHPDAVTFSSAEEDAQRRDFTINGIFFDPLAERVIDFVGGQADLDAGVVRAIGDPHERFSEDKLRMLRAVRFAAALRFRIEPGTLAVIAAMAAQITVVSPERIAAEMRRILVEPGRAAGLAMLLEAGLAEPVLPEIVPRDDAMRERLCRALAILAALESPSFPLALGALLGTLEAPPPQAVAVSLRWRLSNEERDRARWLVEQRTALDAAPSAPWSRVQPVFIHPGCDDLIRLLATRLAVEGGAADVLAWCRQVAARGAAELDPPPLLTGDDLAAMGVPQGPEYRVLLARLRQLQLDGQINSPDEARQMVRQLRADRS